MRKAKTGLGLVLIIVLAAIAVLLFSGKNREEEPEVDLHEGQVLINDGFNDVWMTPYEDVEVNSLKKEDFGKSNGKVYYTGEDYDTVLGIDVSEHQKYIDWNQVAASGVKFVFVRVGYRGYTAGGLFTDPWFRTNADGARAAGLDVGVYFYSQAVNVAEAIAEARYVLEQIEGFDITLPIMYDWEKLEDVEDARTNELDPSIVGDCGVAFCETIRAAGYDAGIYFNRQLGYYSFDLSRLKEFKFWLAVPGDFPDFYYAGNIWQYSAEGEVPGIDGYVDMNLMFIKKPEPTPPPETEETTP